MPSGRMSSVRHRRSCRLLVVDHGHSSASAAAAEHETDHIRAEHRSVNTACHRFHAAEMLAVCYCRRKTTRMTGVMAHQVDLVHDGSIVRVS